MLQLCLVLLHSTLMVFFKINFPLRDGKILAYVVFTLKRNGKKYTVIEMFTAWNKILTFKVKVNTFK